MFCACKSEANDNDAEINLFILFLCIIYIFWDILKEWIIYINNFVLMLLYQTSALQILLLRNH